LWPVREAEAVYQRLLHEEEMMSTRRRMHSIALAGALAAMMVPPQVNAGGQAENEELMRMTQDVLTVVANLPDYTVYDWLTFGIKDNVVYLRGFTRSSLLKTSAASEVKRVKGVQEVKNEVEYVRTSKADEQLRRQVYSAIYDTHLQRYAQEAMHYSPGAPRSSEPMGPHPIHIVVAKGEVTLKGYVFSEEDKQKATHAVESVGGMVKTFTNDLTIMPK
jgi:hypothetical protein